MRILDWIEKTREKPESERKKAAVLLTLLCAVVVIFVWFAVEIIPKKFSGGNSEKGNAVLEKGPVSVVGDMIGETAVKIKRMKIFGE